MRILHTVRSYHPSVGGMQEVVRQISEQLVRFGHDVTVATRVESGRDEDCLNGVKIESFDADGSLARGLSGDHAAYRDFVLQNRFDVVTCFAAQQWATDSLLPVLDQIDAAKVFVPTGFSGLYDETFRDYFADMKDWLARFDMNVFLSEDYRDIDFARKAGISNLTVIPNGASADEFLAEKSLNLRHRLGIPQDHLLLLLVGAHSGLKGHAEAMAIFSRAKLRKATLLIVAEDSPGGCREVCLRKAALSKVHPSWWCSGKRLLVRSLQREETVAAFLEADLLLFPSNVECSPLVLFEAMASRTPFLTSDVGNASEIVKWSKGGEVLPTTVDSLGNSHVDIDRAVQVVERLCRDDQRREELADAGFEAWQDRFTWEIIARQYETLYEGLVRRSDGH